MLKYYFLLAFVALVVAKDSLSFTDCPPGGKNTPKKNDITIETLKIAGCHAQPCTMLKGSVFNLETVLKVTGDFTTKMLPFQLYAVYSSPLPMEVPLIGGNYCDFTVPGKPCNSPVKMNDIIETRKESKVEEFYPSFDGSIRFIIKDDAGVLRFCGELKAKIQGTKGKLL